MAIVENKASEIGDVILIRAEVPIIGLVTLSSFTDSVVNETGAKFFTKEFRYSVDGINFSNWIELNNTNIASVSVTPTATFLIEYKYTRSGVDPNQPDLEFNQVQVNGVFTDVICGDAFTNSIFAQFFSCTDLCVLSWMINVLEKIYKEGILPKYIERGEQNNDYGQDQDFLEFWKSICQYFAYIVCYARQWELSKATSNYDILLTYLRNQTFLFCGDEPIEDLRYIMNNTYDEARHRGTFQIIKTKVDDLVSVDGEWHRLFCNLGKCSDWYFSLVFNYKIGWVGDQASPLYQGNYFDTNLIKNKEKTENVLDLDHYELINPSYVSLTLDTDNNVNEISSMLVTGIIGGTSGIGYHEYTADITKLIPVDSSCDYEITFLVKKLVETTAFSLFVDCYDRDGNLVSGTKAAFSNYSSTSFFTSATLGETDKYYQVRGIVYSKNHRIKPGETQYGYRIHNFIESEHLIFNSEEICFIYPRIVLDTTWYGDESSALLLHNIKVRPLRTYYSTGFEQVANFIKMEVKNSNLNYSNEKAELLMREFLLPYNTTYKIDFLNPPEPTNSANVLDLVTADDLRITSPLLASVRNGDRYLVYENGIYELRQYYSGWSVSPDNSQGNTVYVVEKKCVFIYDNGKWNFSSK